MNGKNDEKTDEKQQEAIRASDLTDTKDGGTVIIEAIFVRAESPITIRIVKPLHKSMSSMALSDLILVIASDLDEKLTEWEKTHKSLTKSSENSQVTGKKERNNPYPEGTPAFEGTQPKCPYCNDGTLLCVKHLVDTKAVGGYDFLAWSCRKWSSDTHPKAIKLNPYGYPKQAKEKEWKADEYFFEKYPFIKSE